MSIFDDYAVSLAALGEALTTVARTAIDNGNPNDPASVAERRERMRQAYIVARANVAIAESMAKFALSQTADKASQIATAAGHLVSDSSDRLKAAAVQFKQDIVDSVTNAYDKAVQLGADAARGVGQAIDDRAKAIFWSFEAQVLNALAALGVYFWWKSSGSAQPTRADMLRELQRRES